MTLPDRVSGPLAFLPMDEAAARAIHAWRYEPPYDVYNLDATPVHGVLGTFLDRQNDYYSIVDAQGDLVAFCCFGPDARVPGGEDTALALDVGLGVRPDLTGQGWGLSFVRATIDFALCHRPPAALRVTIAAFNLRAQRVWHRAGFRLVQAFERTTDGRPFVILVWGPAALALEKETE